MDFLSGKPNQPRKPMKLSANENYYGCSPQVKKAIREKTNEVHFYHDVPVKLEEKLAEKFKINISNIAVGAGSVRLIDGIIQSLVGLDEEVLTFERSFLAYGQLAATHQRKCSYAPLSNYTCELKNLLPFIKANTRVVFIANPNNPTGTIISHTDLKQFLQSISPGINVIIDEAYCEYVTDKNYPDSLSLMKEFSNLVILRTFSKVYGLAGLRIGFAMANEKVIGTLKKNRIPYFMNCFSAGAAIAALEDENFVSKSVRKNSKERVFLFKNLKKLGLNVIPSQGNFLYLIFNDEDSKMNVFNALKENGILICNMAIFGQDKSLRISIGDRKCGKKIIDVLKALVPGSASPSQTLQ